MTKDIKDNKNEEVKEVECTDNTNTEVDRSVNNIVIKPIVNIDIDIEDLEIGCAPTLNEPQKKE